MLTIISFNYRKRFIVSKKTKANRKFYVRFATSSDYKKVMDFYQTNEHDSVRKREEALLKNLSDQGSIVFVEDDKGEIVAASISYAHQGKDSNGVTVNKWLEVGSTRIAANGFAGLFNVMCTAQVLRTFLVEPPEDCFVGHMENRPVQKIAESLGWKAFTAPQEMLKSSDKTINTGDIENRNQDGWYNCDMEGVGVMAKCMVDAMNKPTLKHYKTGEEVEITIERCPVLNMFWPNIEALAKKDFNAPENKNDKAMGIRKNRDKWLYKLR